MHTDCGPCVHRDRCVRAKKRSIRRTLTVRPKAPDEALPTACQRKRAPEFAAAYAVRARIEATRSRGVRCCRLRRTCSIGEVLRAVGEPSD